jgi:hypothetical protein
MRSNVPQTRLLRRGRASRNDQAARPDNREGNAPELAACQYFQAVPRQRRSARSRRAWWPRHRTKTRAAGRIRHIPLPDRVPRTQSSKAPVPAAARRSPCPQSQHRQWPRDASGDLRPVNRGVDFATPRLTRSRGRRCNRSEVGRINSFLFSRNRNSPGGSFAEIPKFQRGKRTRSSLILKRAASHRIFAPPMAA